jgi:hypothetical protein
LCRQRLDVRVRTFVKTLHRLHDPLMAMLTGEIRVYGVERMGDFGWLFPAVPFGARAEHPPGQSP